MFGEWRRLRRPPVCISTLRRRGGRETWPLVKLSGTSLLLLEDEPLLRRRIASHLEELGVEVTTATTIAEAREAFRNVSFEFALLDVNLPDGRSLVLLEEKAM